jgi:hypothetical protein
MLNVNAQLEMDNRKRLRYNPQLNVAALTWLETFKKASSLKKANAEAERGFRMRKTILKKSPPRLCKCSRNISPTSRAQK